MFDFSFNPCEPNGFTTYVMNSSELVDKIFKTFKERISCGEDWVAALNYGYSINNINFEDLTLYDQQRLKSLIEEYLNGGIY